MSWLPWFDAAFLAALVSAVAWLGLLARVADRE
jgi:hypothetical protein